MTTINPAQQKALNALAYFAERINALTFQKAIQLLYLADEYAVSESGAPNTWLDYHVWKSGPVPEDLYNKIMQATNPQQELTAIAEAPLLIENIKSSFRHLDSVLLVSVKPFDDSRFSDFEVLVLQDIVNSYGHYIDGNCLTYCVIQIHFGIAWCQRTT